MATATASPSPGGPIDGGKFAGYIQGVEKRLATDPFKEAMEACVRPIERGVGKNFQNSATADGVLWAPRKQRTKRWRLNDGSTFDWEHPLLILTGDLFQSVTMGASSDAVKEIVPRGLSRGTTIDYAGFLNFGTRNMPAREFMNVPEEFLAECDDIIADAGLEFF